MDYQNNEILKIAQKEKAGREFDRQINFRAIRWGYWMTCLVGCGMSIAERLINGTQNNSLMATLGALTSAIFLYEGIKLKSVWQIVLGTLQALFTSYFFVLEIINLLK